jgi:Fe-S-cluster containining protein
LNPAVRAAYQAFDVEVGAIVREARRLGMSVPCRAACDACCHDIAWATTPEAEQLAERVRSMPRARRAEVLERIARWFEEMRLSGLDPQDPNPDLRTYHRAQLACPMLDREAHRCMAYDVRPIACRGHYVLAPDASVCANRAKEPVILTLIVEESHQRAYERMGGGRRGGIQVACSTKLLQTALAEQLGVQDR